MTEPKLALLSLMMEQYDRWSPQLRPAQQPFLARLASFLETFGAVARLPLCTDRSAVDAAVAQAEQDQADLLVVVLLSYTPSLIALPALHRTRLPVLLLNTTPRSDMGPGIAASDYLENHAIHGVQDLANVLLRAGKRPWIASGHLDDPALSASVSAHIAAARAARLWQQLRVGRVGPTFPEMGDLFFDETALLRSGPAVLDIAPQEYADAWAEVVADDINALLGQYQRGYDTSRVGRDCLTTTARAECAARSLVARHRLGALALSFLIFERLPAGPAMPFAAASRMMAEGIGYAGEADALGAAGVAVLHRLTGCAGFTEMFCPDWERSEVLMSHMGEANPQFARGRPVLVEKPSLVKGGAPSGVLLFESEPGPATIASLTASPAGGLRWVISEGEIVPSPLYPALDAPHYKFRPRLPLPDFLTAYSEAGGSHHLALCRGQAASAIQRLAGAIGVEFQSV
ncbi:MAG: hypothetical protein ACE149_11745 [Armatimonadota bacterium]